MLDLKFRTQGTFVVGKEQSHGQYWRKIGGKSRARIWWFGLSSDNARRSWESRRLVTISKHGCL